MHWRRANRKFWLCDRPLTGYFTEATVPGISDAGRWESYQAWSSRYQGQKIRKRFLGWAPDYCDGGCEQQS